MQDSDRRCFVRMSYSIHLEYYFADLGTSLIQQIKTGGTQAYLAVEIGTDRLN